MICNSCGHQLTFYIILYLVDQSYSLANPMMNMEQAHPQPTIFDGELKSYQLKVDFIVWCICLPWLSLVSLLILMCLNYFSGNELAYQPLWTGICYMYMLESNKNDQLFSCSGFGSMTWRSLFGFQFINWVNTFDFTNMCVLWDVGLVEISRQRKTIMPLCQKSVHLCKISFQ